MAETNPDIKSFIDYAFTEFHDETGDKLFIDGKKDGRLIQLLLATYTLDELKAKWLLFLASDDPFIAQAGYSLGIFKISINKLIGKRKPRYKPRPDMPDLEEPEGGRIDMSELKKLIKGIGGDK